MADDQNTLDWLRLIRSENIGPITFQKLIQYHGNAGRALAALPEMAKRGGRKKPLVAMPEAEGIAEIESLKKLGGQLIIQSDPEYPDHLKACEDAPPVLSVLGNVALLKTQGIGIVGGRNASINGLKLAGRFADALAQNGTYPIISGLARGIDAAAHKSSLQHGTVAVVAGGIDVIYPEQNTDLYNEIVEHGCVVAESPFGVKPQRHYFPKRNRIIAGLSHGVVVIEAKKGSGSLITANMAMDYGRDVYALPGSPMDPRAAGGNDLIKRDTARLVTSPEDILKDIQIQMKSPLREPDRSDAFDGYPQSMIDATAPQDDQSRAAAAKTIENALSDTPVQINEIIRATGIKPAHVQAILLDMELAGRIERQPGGLISLILT